MAWEVAGFKPAMWEVRYHAGAAPSQGLFLSVAAGLLSFSSHPMQAPRFPCSVFGPVICCSCRRRLAGWLDCTASHMLLEPSMSKHVHLCTLVSLWEQPFQFLLSQAILREGDQSLGLN